MSGVLNTGPVRRLEELGPRLVKEPAFTRGDVDDEELGALPGAKSPWHGISPGC
jgi:hypothetical protein